MAGREGRGASFARRGKGLSRCDARRLSFVVGGKGQARGGGGGGGDGEGMRAILIYFRLFCTWPSLTTDESLSKRHRDGGTDLATIEREKDRKRLGGRMQIRHRESWVGRGVGEGVIGS